jgi:hypothetical protein
MNGEHTNKIEIDLRNLSTNEITSVISRGVDGVFYVDDPKYGVYSVERFSYTSHGPGGATFNLYHILNDGVIFSIKEQNAVYNLGDLEWYAKCVKRESKEYSRAVVEHLYEVQTKHYYQKNFTDLKAWFEISFPDSSWNNRNWINVEYETR